MRFLRRIKDFFIPSNRNVYRPAVLGRGSLLFFLAVMLAAEGFLVANLVGRHSFIDFIAAVIGSEIVLLTNTERTAAAAPALTENPLLAQAAQAKAEHMAAHGYFAHTSPDGKLPWAWVAEAGYDYRFAGENLAVRFVDSSDVVEAWMNSPGHRANIVKPVYQEIGIGIAQGTYKGASATFVVQFFGTPRAVATVTAPLIVASEPIAPGSASSDVPEVAGEAVSGAVVTEPAPASEAPPAAPIAAATKSSSFIESTFKAITRAFAEPRATTALLLGSVAVALMVAVAIVFLIHPQVQPTDLLLKGSLVAVLALALIGINAKGLSTFSGQGGQAATVGSLWEQSSDTGVVIGETGESTERFIIEY